MPFPELSRLPVFASSQGGRPRTHHFLFGPGLLPGAFLVGQPKSKLTKNQAPPWRATAGLHTGKMEGAASVAKELVDCLMQEQRNKLSHGLADNPRTCEWLVLDFEYAATAVNAAA